MKKVQLIIILSFFIGLTSQVFSQSKLLKTIEQTDELFDSQKAFNRLDSIRKKSKLTPKEKLVLIQKLSQRSLEINDYKKLSNFCIQGINLTKAGQNDSLQAYFYKFLAISQNEMGNYCT